MANDSYGPLVYHKQGSTELVIASSGLLTVEDGGEITLESGGHLDVESAGYIDIESGGMIKHFVSGATSSEAGSTDFSTLTNDGYSLVLSSGDTRMLYLTAPYEGALKFIHLTAGSTGTVIYLDAEGVSTGTKFYIPGTNSTTRYLIREGTTASAAEADLMLIGLSTALWRVWTKSTGWVNADTSS